MRFLYKTGTNARILIGNAEIPFELETLHFCITGATGTGKSVTLEQLLGCVIPRGDRCLIIDPAGSCVSKFYRRGEDRILNCFDSRGESWSIFNEVRSNLDFIRLAKNLVPDGYGADAVWNSYAQNLIAETLKALVSRGESTTEKLLYWLTVSSNSELAGLLGGTSCQSLFEEGASRALSSTRFVITNNLLPHQFLKPGKFSLRDWLLNEGGNLFLSWHEDSIDALKPLITAWVDIVANTALSLSPNSKRRFWIVLDELGGIGYLNSLESLLTRGRKNGICVVSCLQSVAQLDRLYGKDSSTIIRSCFRNLLVLACAKSDPYTAEEMSRALGEQEFDRLQHGRNTSIQGVNQSATLERASERLVLPSELTEMDNLQGYLALAGARATRKVKLVPENRTQVAHALEAF